jgi:hypothetical protein
MYLTVSRPLYYREYLGGPMFIAQAASEQARRGLDSYLQFLAMINVAVMSFNLLPIPVLDGGHILLALVQAVRRRAISARGYMRFQRVGLVVIVTLFVFILANDPLRWCSVSGRWIGRVAAPLELRLRRPRPDPVTTDPWGQATKRTPRRGAAWAAAQRSFDRG